MNTLRPTRFQSGGSPLGNTYTVAFSDFSRAMGAGCLEVVEDLFSRYGVVPVEAIAEFGEQRAIGSYARTRKRIGGFLQAAELDKPPSLNIEIGGSERRKDPNFYYHGAAAALSTTRQKRSAWFGVDETRVERPDEFVDFIAARVLQHFGPCYGYFLEYPKHFWAGCYIGAVVSVPPGMDVTAFSEYGERISRWRDRKWHQGLRESQGYLREVYHINFLLDAHLKMLVGGRPFREVAGRLGELISFQQCPGVYKWTVAIADLELARDELESSGLILSSPTEPLQR